MEKSIKSSAINFGLYLGGIMAALTIIPYAINLDLIYQMVVLLDLYLEFNHCIRNYFCS